MNYLKCTVTRHFWCNSDDIVYYSHYCTNTAYSILPIRPSAGNFYCQPCYNTAYKNYYSQSCNNTDYYAGADFGIIVSLPARLTIIVLIGSIRTRLTIDLVQDTSTNCHYSVIVII